MNDHQHHRLPNKLLIANRGEIAVRIIRTAREMGIRTVLPYARQDVNTLGAELADEAYALDGDTAAATYLNPDAILDVARRSGADALHPGYGFLSENADFAAAVENAGLTWIGPSARVIASLGDKIQARHYAQAGGVNMIPGVSHSLGEVRSGRETVTRFIAEHGYPILIKRADGGGGHGITRITNPDELEEFFINHADDEAGLRLSFVEKLMLHCRHVETQCLRDAHGTFAIASTRDCSVQRRNQKLIEEAPAPFLSAATRARLFEWSRSLFEATGYVGVGTCEFLVDRAGTPYFLEVNPRLQVEHTVSEEVTGTDLVAEQLRIAARLPVSPALAANPAPRQAAIEIRITSEDPANALLPVTGRVSRVDWPGGRGVRVDSYIRPGDEIGGVFDSMIAKITVSAPDRLGAIVRLLRVLDEFCIEGVPTCAPLLRRIIADPAFTALPAGQALDDAVYRSVSRRGIAAPVAALPQGYYGAATPSENGDEDAVTAAGPGPAARPVGATNPSVATASTAPETAPDDNESAPAPTAANFRVYTKWMEDTDVLGQVARDLRDAAPGGEATGATTAAGPRAVGTASSSPATDPAAERPAPPTRAAVIEIDGRRVSLRLPTDLFAATPAPAGAASSPRLRPQPLLRRHGAAASQAPAGSADATAPMQATVVHLAVEVGQRVKAGQLVAVIEAMKMESYVHASQAGSVRAVPVKPGDSVHAGQVIAHIDPASAPIETEGTKR